MALVSVKLMIILIIHSFVAGIGAKILLKLHNRFEDHSPFSKMSGVFLLWKGFIWPVTLPFYLGYVAASLIAAKYK